jgi:two-component system sensor histidine kinase CpxA
MPPLDYPPPPGFLQHFIITFLIGGLVCYGLAWRFTGPIRKLRAAAQGLAKGDLSIRVNSRSKGLGAEVADLMQDFNRMAERIESLVNARKQLVRDVSHELRSPLARLNVALALARREDIPVISGSLDRIEREAERLNSIIGDLLTLSLMESKVSVEMKPFDLTQLVEEVVRDAEYEAAHLGRHVLFAGSGPVLLSGNRELLRRALENVVRNGVRHTKEGTEVEVRLEHEPSGHAAITVLDRGPGVPRDALRDIFRPFYRLETARDRSSGGTGLGLSITDRSVRLHGGTVEASNREDGGLMVVIRLPHDSDGRDAGHP